MKTRENDDLNEMKNIEAGRVGMSKGSEKETKVCHLDSTFLLHRK